MENKKTFFAGFAVGAVLIFVINFSLGPAISTYNKAKGVEQKLTPENKVTEILDILNKYYVEDFDIEQLQEGMYTGFVYGVGDPYTTYMDKDYLKKFIESLEGTFAGVGIYVSPNTKTNRITVISPIEGSPAYAAGIKPKDIITKVNGIDVYADTLDEAITMMKGKEGTSVNVTIYRESEERTFDISLKRAIINVPTVAHKMLENSIGYLRITGFDEVTYDQFMEAYNDLNSQGMKGLVIDLRNNPGGLLDIVVKIADELVPEGKIVYTEDKNGKTKFSYSDKKQIEVPLALIVNGSSASASEVLAGAVKDLGVGELVGTQTFGKGLVQTLYPLSDGSGVKVTIAKYYTPSGVCIDKVGIKPDYIVEMEHDDDVSISNLTFEEDVQLKKAFEVVESKIKK